MWGQLAALGGGLGLGLIKQNQQKAEYNRQKQQAADIHRFSPWTGLTGEGFMPKKNPNMFDNLLQGGLTGAMMGQQFGGMGGGAEEAGGTVPTLSGGAQTGWLGVDKSLGGMYSPY